MRAHARNGEPTTRICTLQKVTAAAPFWIGHDRLPPDLMKRNVLRRMSGGTRDGQRAKYALRIARRPLQHLHSAHRAAGNGKERLDAQMIEQHGLRANHVADRNDWKVESPRLPGPWIRGRRTRRAHACTHHVRADHEIAL